MLTSFLNQKIKKRFIDCSEKVEGIKPQEIIIKMKDSFVKRRG
jgi:hypothetical protein